MQLWQVFRDQRFLVLATGLGITCTLAYYATGGSLLAAAVTHWIPVAVWLFGLGGIQRLQYVSALRQ
jgi:predicted Abi (CAAX) family protease